MHRFENFSTTISKSLVVPGDFGSRSMLLGVLLIKTLPSKCISQIRLDISKIYKKKKKKECALRKTKKEEEEEEDSTDDKGKRDFYHGKACSNTERLKQREERMA